MRRGRGSGSPTEPTASITTGSARMLTASKRMQAGVDVGGDREHKQKHEAPLDNEPDALKVDGNVEAVEIREPEGEPEGDGEALGDGEVLEPKGRCQHKRRPYWRFGRRRHTATACSAFVAPVASFCSNVGRSTCMVGGL